jgi:hypothetical protein
MYLEDLIPTPNSTKVAAVSQKVFGRSINVESLTKEKAKSLRETFAQRLEQTIHCTWKTNCSWKQ